MPLPVITVNHFYVVVGPKTFAAMRDSDFFRKTFANVELKKNTAIGIGEWTGLYLRGDNTYLEFFDTFQNRTTGDYGFGFGYENKGELNQAFPILARLFRGSSKGAFQQPKDPAPLFHYIQLPEINSAKTGHTIDPFIIEYSEKGFEIRGSKGKYSVNDISRKRYNSTAYNPNGLVKDVSAITISVEPETSQSLARILQSLNFSVSGKSYTTQEGITIHLDSQANAAPPKGLLIQMSLNKRVEKKEVHLLGDARLELEGYTARLIFK